MNLRLIAFGVLASSSIQVFGVKLTITSTLGQKDVVIYKSAAAAPQGKVKIANINQSSAPYTFNTEEHKKVDLLIFEIDSKQTAKIYPQSYTRDTALKVMPKSGGIEVVESK
ncbi:MAG: hypothetical protein ACHQVS_03340 [Candidatus Babeliales bacterium]